MAFWENRFHFQMRSAHDSGHQHTGQHCYWFFMTFISVRLWCLYFEHQISLFNNHRFDHLFQIRAVFIGDCHRRSQINVFFFHLLAVDFDYRNTFDNITALACKNSQPSAIEINGIQLDMNQNLDYVAIVIPKAWSLFPTNVSLSEHSENTPSPIIFDEKTSLDISSIIIIFPPTGA